MKLNRIEAAYWLTLAFRLDGVGRREKNGLVLNAARHLGLGLLDLVQLELGALPPQLSRYAETLGRLQEADGLVSGMAFLVDELIERGVELLPITHPDYPAHLAHRLRPEHAPTLLSAAGELGLLAQAGVCISGSRKAGVGGLAFARACGAALARAGLTVVSGLAAGVDREGLSGALDAGGRVIGVCPEGILGSRALRDPMLGAGRLCVVSEFHPKQPWQAGAAMARNRTLAGLSRALVVADCVAEGGTTNQLEVHRGLGLPVMLRRGADEGAMVAALAQRAGVLSLRWEAGPVALPESLTGSGSTLELPEGHSDPVDAGLGAERISRAELTALDARIAQLRAELATLEERRARALRKTTTEPGAEAPQLMLLREPAPAGYAVAVTEVDGQVEGALRGSPTPMSVSELSGVLGVPEAKVRASVGSLLAAGRVEKLRVGRFTRYAVPKELALFGR